MPERRKSMQPKTRAILDTIDAFLSNEEATETLELWSILTALRGPDVIGEAALKTDYTLPIRTIAFPLTSQKSNVLCIATFAKQVTAKPSPQNLLLTFPQPWSHFVSHLWDAIASIHNYSKT